MAATTLNNEQALAYCVNKWDETIIPTLSEYIEIPNQSPDYDPEWATNGYMDQAVNLMVEWVKKQDVAGLAIEVVKDEGRTPLIYIVIDAFNGGPSENTVMLYAHLDKQPPMTENWSEGLGPHLPVIRDGRLFGRGGADDGYGIFASITAIKALQDQGVPHSRSVILVEASEESGSTDLTHYVTSLADRIGAVDFVVCLDSGTGDLQHLWSTTSLRGVVNVNLKVDILNDGVHSGAASGIVPDSFRIARMLLNRIENPETGELIGAPFHVDIPQTRVDQANATAGVLGETVYSNFPWATGAGPTTTDSAEAILRKSWKPTLSVTGADGLPPSAVAGNVLRASTTLKLSFRLPPTADADAASAFIVKELTRDPPYGATVTVSGDHGASGWEAPAEAEWQLAAMHGASQAFYGNDAMFIGEGGSIPFMGLLGERFPSALFMVTGVLDGISNAHGPDESFDLDFAKKLTASVAFIIAAHASK
ncbi:succinyl-diaminopimelate desuccinylase [Thecamonas trahens ATCC 50062]|uniref:Succinyl-diaminopimelate desuccinylase n=1 Tax=Thecamonas trahens ATCC 50062 TaxID=461836 RepID=A0A0L0D6U7_THETB|nr:succinyl-diaminopimelate desuccinylase [Thecamonas trahens ATCC 50062]KNC48077.1 succinyl-diaminopimelate desuccinylase [Thecamonas trahens ATCC 50062]|eukprot:XP_013759092.1 succinyl-diaminopimelate desuccinylase [Thecamonas trahens ATCC 50062]